MNPTADFWNQRYAASEYAYGLHPNEYLKEKLSSLNPGSIMFPADGEGRNSVFAAELGWNSHAFDLSEQGRQKALQLAAQKGVSIHYQLGSPDTITVTPHAYDAIALIYAHFQAQQRFHFHQQLLRGLKPGGVLILEAFSKKQLAYQARGEKSGGPREENMLYSLEIIQEDFGELQFHECTETEITLAEGSFHQGLGSVIRLFASKPV